MNHRIAQRALYLAVSALIAAAALLPIIWGLLSSFKTPREILQATPRWLPETFTLENYVSIFKAGTMGYVLNSVLVSGGTVVLCLVLGALAGYGLARFQFPGKRAVTVAIIAVMSIPVASLLIPTYTLMAEAGLVNTRLGLILVYSAYQLPLVIWIMATYYQTLPEELEWSALIDGYSRAQTLWKIVLPLSRPALIAATLFVLTFAWNDFVVAVTMTSSEATRTFPVAIYFYLGFYGREWGPLLAASIVSIVPIVAVFVALQRHFMSGLTGGGVKG
jgi:ABC-type glycerol-3-phosphate transport system permease component